MKKNIHRSGQVAETVRQVLGEALIQEIRDPRVGRVTITAVTVTPDLSAFGRYNGTLATCDAQAGRCMQFALRYEF
ncbi:MAG: ribosome-binding factor A [Gemmatimonadota bacterium]